MMGGTPGAGGGTAEVVRIAMWSGPRNLSTAMMRAFENRADTVVVDEPFYAAYLTITGIDHPMREEIIAAQPADPLVVAETLFAPQPDGIAIHYQKHMTHHMVPAIPRDWMRDVRNVFLIRSPERVLASYAAKRDTVAPGDIGFSRQAELFDSLCERTGTVPPVVDSGDLLENPPAMLRALCGALAIAFDPDMLAWPAGRRSSDGVWAPHWYASVERSTGFAPASPRPVLEDRDLRRIAEAAAPHYEKLARHRLRPDEC